jgi:hypothetical protein
MFGGLSGPEPSAMGISFRVNSIVPDIDVLLERRFLCSGARWHPIDPPAIDPVCALGPAGTQQGKIQDNKIPDGKFLARRPSRRDGHWRDPVGHWRSYSP